jgi:hypothetical protein
METNYQPPEWLALYLRFEATRAGASDDPIGQCRQCARTVFSEGAALCRTCELRFGYLLPDWWPRCADCSMPFGNGLEHGVWVSRSTENLCGYCDWLGQGYSIRKMLEVIVCEMTDAPRFVATIGLQLNRSNREKVVRTVADCMWCHPTLVEMLKHNRCTVLQVADVFLGIAEEIVAAVIGEEIEIDALASRDGWQPSA